MRRAFFRVAGVLVLMAGLLAAFGVTGSSAQAPPPLPGASSKPSPVWNVQPGQVRVYVWVWWYNASGQRVAGKPVKIRNWRGAKLVGWQTAHSEHYRELRLKPNTRVCVKAFVKNAKTTPTCQVVTNSGQKLVFVIRVGAKAPTPTGPRPPTPPPTPTPPPPPVTPVTPKQGGVFATLNCIGGAGQGGSFSVQATVNGILQLPVGIGCNQRVQVALLPRGTVVPVCFLAGGLPLLCKQAVAGVRGVVFTLTPPVTPAFADVWLHAVCSPGAQVGVVVYVNGFPRGSAETFICSTPKQVGLFSPGTVLQFCIQFPLGSVWSGGGPCIPIVIDGRGRVVLNLTVIFTIVVITTTPPPGGTTTVVTTVTTPTTTSGVPANPNP